MGCPEDGYPGSECRKNLPDCFQRRVVIGTESLGLGIDPQSNGQTLWVDGGFWYVEREADRQVGGMMTKVSP